jgi:hypothetical protein
MLNGTKKEIVDSLVRQTGLQQNGDIIPKVNTNVQPIVNVSPFRTAQKNYAGVAAGTLYTVGANEDFYLTGVWVSGSNTANGTVGTCGISVTPEDQGAVLILNLQISCNGIAESNDNALARDLFIPIKLKKGSAIQLTNTTTAVAGGVSGYIVERL